MELGPNVSLPSGRMSNVRGLRETWIARRRRSSMSRPRHDMTTHPMGSPLSPVSFPTFAFRGPASTILARERCTQVVPSSAVIPLAVALAAAFTFVPRVSFAQVVPAEGSAPAFQVAQVDAEPQDSAGGPH